MHDKIRRKEDLSVQSLKFLKVWESEGTKALRFL